MVQESGVAMAAANAAIWETRLDISERAKQEFRENAKKLMVENNALQSQLMTTERDTIDVITYLKKQDQEKDHQVERLQNQVRDMYKEQRQEKQTLIEEYSKHINELEERLNEKKREIDIMQIELKLVKEFRRKRASLQKELDDIKESMHNTHREHKATLVRMEQKFFEEKMQLQQEANQKIAELADKAHTEAIANLDETTKSVYKENVRLSEALNYHMKEGDLLKKERQRLTEEVDKLLGEKEVNNMIVQEKVVQSKKQKDLIKELQEKVHTLEKSLSHVVQEFESERQLITDNARIESEAARVELAKLQRVIEMKTKEMVKVKRLAKNILDQRTELERFFLESLEQVQTEIATNQIQYRRDAQLAYQKKMLAASTGKGDFPKIRTFNNTETSTNSVFKDIEAAEQLYGINGKVDVEDLTWEQKERVLRYLFARMNGTVIAPPAIAKQAALPPISPTGQKNSSIKEKAEAELNSTFLTQAQLEPAMTSFAETAAAPAQA